MRPGGPAWKAPACAALCILSGVWSTAYGQASDQPDTPDAVQDVSTEDSSREVTEGVDQITVTGTQSDVTNVQNEAQAVTAFSMEDLDRNEIVNVESEPA